MNTRNINNIINHINSIKNGTCSKNGICILVGAGADISSGGILFRELKMRFLKENGCIVPSNISDRNLDEKFEEHVEMLSSDGRCETLEKIMKRYNTPSEGYSLLVILAELGYINAVVTTNFDCLLEETQDLLNQKPFTIYTPGRSIPDEFYLRRTQIPPVYLKMHGDISDRLVTHLTTKELQKKKYGDEFKQLFKYIVQNNSIISVGYGGYDELITEIFEQEINTISEVFWCNIAEPSKESRLAQILERHNKLSYVKTSFDNLFQELAKHLLKNEKMKSISPIFLPTIVQSKFENQKYLFSRKFENCNKIINRLNAQDVLEKYLQTFENKCIVVRGKYKYGKSCFVYKIMQTMYDITFLPIICDCEHSILQNMALSLGYVTDVPFSIMYSFFNWWNKQKKHLVVIMDDFFNENNFQKMNINYIIEFFNFLYVAHDFKYIQFIVCIQDNVYEKIDKNSILKQFKYMLSNCIEIQKFSDLEVKKLLNANGIKNKISLKENIEMLKIPYIWEILYKNEITLIENTDFFTVYIDSIYNNISEDYTFTKHALNQFLSKFAYNQLFGSKKMGESQRQEYYFLQKQGVIDTTGEIIYPELLVHFCAQYFFLESDWEEVVSKRITKSICSCEFISYMQTEVYITIMCKIDNIDKYDVLFRTLDKIIYNSSNDISIKRIVIRVLQKCFETKADLIQTYLASIDINIYSSLFQRYLLKVCIEENPDFLLKWQNSITNNDLVYTVFVITNDVMYNSLKSKTSTQISSVYEKYFSNGNGVLKLLHLLSYWGWDNLRFDEYTKLNSIITNEIFPKFKKLDNTAIEYSAKTLEKYAYNIFFNAGTDFEEQYVRMKSLNLNTLIQKVLNGGIISKDEYINLVKLNTDINNSWTFIVSNIIIIRAMQNNSSETYEMMYYFWDDIYEDVKVQQLDFYLSSTFWSLYANEPYNRDKFVKIFERVIEKYERILFSFPSTKRTASINKFSDEFDMIFEDGFNPIAFYFYTAPYNCLVNTASEWNNGKENLKLYWRLAEQMSEYGKFDDILRIIHALGQMISIYPEEGYMALENLIRFDQPVLKQGIIRIFKENYIRYSKLTSKEIKKTLYHLTNKEIDEIIYNTNFLLENRTLEQLHWSRLFFNLEQILKTNLYEVFLKKILNSNSCHSFLKSFIETIFE